MSGRRASGSALLLFEKGQGRLQKDRHAQSFQSQQRRRDQVELAAQEQRLNKQINREIASFAASAKGIAAAAASAAAAAAAAAASTAATSSASAAEPSAQKSQASTAHAS